MFVHVSMLHRGDSKKDVSAVFGPRVFLSKEQSGLRGVGLRGKATSTSSNFKC